MMGYSDGGCELVRRRARPFVDEQKQVNASGMKEEAMKSRQKLVLPFPIAPCPSLTLG